MARSISFRTFIISLTIALAISSCEKDDFIPTPTPTSVIVTGVITTTSGKPLANIPVSIDYCEGYWLGPQTTLHKAKGTTDSSGYYELFFEPEKDKSSYNNKPNQVYRLYADLNGLSPDEYIMPSEFGFQSTVYSYEIYKIFEQGDNHNINLFFPKKKEIKTELKNFTADKSLKIVNTMVFGATKESIDKTVELDTDGNGSVMIPYAIDDTNLVSVVTENGVSEVCETKEISITKDSDSPVVFDNKDILDDCSFKLSLYSHMSFNGKEYNDNRAFSSPAPFDFIGFRIVRPDGQYEAMDLKRYQYYDSIVWSSPDFPETFKVYEKKTNETTSVEHLVSQWGSHFFNTGIHKTTLTGYKNGRAICTDSVEFDLKDRDFLCFDWNNFIYLTDHGTTQTIYCQLDGFSEYQLNAVTESDESNSVNIYIKFRDNWGDDIELNWQQIRLEYLLSQHLGHWIEYDKSKVKEMFRHLTPADQPGTLYENETTRAIVMQAPATESDKEHFYIHAEPKH